MLVLIYNQVYLQKREFKELQLAFLYDWSKTLVVKSQRYVASFA